TNNLRDFRPLHHDAITPGGPGHYGMIFVPSTYRRTKADTGRIITALETILTQYPGETDLANSEARLWLECKRSSFCTTRLSSWLRRWVRTFLSNLDRSVPISKAFELSVGQLAEFILEVGVNHASVLGRDEADHPAR